MSRAFGPRQGSLVNAALRRTGIDPDAPWLVKLFALFLHPGSPSAGSATRAIERLFPQVDFYRLRLVDIVRIPLQLVALALVRFKRQPAERAGVPVSRRWVPESTFPRLVRQSIRSGWALVQRLIRPITRLIDGMLVRFNKRGDELVDHFLWRSRPMRILIMTGAAILALLAVTTPLEPTSQMLFAFTLFAFVMLVRRVTGKGVTLLLVVISVLASTRYLWWRLAYTMNWDDSWALAWGALLVTAEIYAWLALLLGYFQSAWPLNRQPVPLPNDRGQWPTIDVYVPTYNEPLTVVAPTVIAALAMDWPREKLRVFLLDDGRRDEMRQFAAKVGVQYITRPDNRHAKAGNLNHALALTSGEYIAIFDCDHVPTRGFLQSAMGWFLRDERLALVQTPHHFFSPDPFERNLRVFRRMPNEGELFHGLIQDGNDLWNATFFCGSCAVIRRGPLEEAGGIAVETVTEDAHTALRLQRLGYGTALINIPLAGGLAAESLSAHVGQRIRWARGMAQIFRLDNPFRGPGLRFAQRICYGSAMLHFFNGGPRLIFLTAPLAFLPFHLYIIHASAVDVLLYVLPHLIHASITNSRIHGRHRRSYWSEVYETVLAWYILLPTTLALINPRYGKFNVTAKGGVTENDQFDWRVARPFLFLAGLNLIALGFGMWQLGNGPADEFGTTLLNLAWTMINLLILGAAIAVAAERAQRRARHRAEIIVPVRLQTAGGASFQGRTVDISIAGAALAFQLMPEVRAGNDIKVSFLHDEQGTAFAARVVAVTPPHVRLEWSPMSQSEAAALVHCSVATSGAWSTWGEGRRRDRPLRSLVEVLFAGIDGYRTLAGHAFNLVAGPFRPALCLVASGCRILGTLLPRAPSAEAEVLHYVPHASGYAAGTHLHGLHIRGAGAARSVHVKVGP
ncbi:MAG: UDP-forming cellulose synthase catalytic subunit [Burkholderiales bacterium]